MSIQTYIDNLEDHILELKKHIKLISEMEITENNNIPYDIMQLDITPFVIYNNSLEKPTKFNLTYWDNYVSEQRKQYSLIRKTLPYMTPFILQSIN